MHLVPSYLRKGSKNQAGRQMLSSTCGVGVDDLARDADALEGNT